MPAGTWLEEVYRRHRRPLLLTAWNVLRCPTLAEDAVQSAFAGLVDLRRVPDDPKLYVFRAVRNAAIDISRSRARRRERPMLAETEEALSGNSSAEADSLASIAAALERLDPAAREIVELHIHGELTFQEIATLLEEPLQTVASRYRRALERLRRLPEMCRE
jgi:RNA polymerase sigma-70 factor (ECF subfamily)